MIRIYPNDLLATEQDGVYYYSLILDKISCFGGQLSFVFYHKSHELEEPMVLLDDKTDGFHAIVDYIWSKRENRLHRISKKVETNKFIGPGYYKNTHDSKTKAPAWWIYDEDGNEIDKVTKLTKEQKKYPLLTRIDDTIMIDRVSEKWSILNDCRL